MYGRAAPCIFLLSGIALIVVGTDWRNLFSGGAMTVHMTLYAINGIFLAAIGAASLLTQPSLAKRLRKINSLWREGLITETAKTDLSARALSDARDREAIRAFLRWLESSETVDMPVEDIGLLDDHMDVYLSE